MTTTISHATGSVSPAKARTERLGNAPPDGSTPRPAALTGHDTPRRAPRLNTEHLINSYNYNHLSHPPPHPETEGAAEGSRRIRTTERLGKSVLIEEDPPFATRIPCGFLFGVRFAGSGRRLAAALPGFGTPSRPTALHASLVTSKDSNRRGGDTRGPPRSRRLLLRTRTLNPVRGC